MIKDLDYVYAPDVVWSMFQSDIALGVIVGLFLLAVGALMRKAVQLENELEDVV